MKIKKVNIVVGRFQPFTKGHKRMIELMYRENGLSTVVFYIENKKKDSRHPFSDDIVRETIKRSLNSDLLSDCFSVKSADIVQIGKMLYEHNYEAVLFGCGSDRENAYKKQIENEKYRNDGHFTENFKLFSIKRNNNISDYANGSAADAISATKVRNAIKADDYDSFRSMMSVENNTKLRSLFDKMKEEIDSVIL